MSSGAHCHKAIRKVARGLAAACYDEVMRDDLVFKTWKSQNPEIAGKPKLLLLAFVNRNWGRFVEGARTTLALLLRQPIDERQKEEIMEILVLDKSLVRGRMSGQQIAGIINPKG